MFRNFVAIAQPQPFLNFSGNTSSPVWNEKQVEKYSYPRITIKMLLYSINTFVLTGFVSKNTSKED